MFQSGIARPGALQIVADIYGQAADALYFQVNLIAVLECAKPAVIGACGKNIARLQGMNG